MPVINLELWEAADVAVDEFKRLWTGTPLANVLVQNQDNSSVDNQKDPWVRVTAAEIGGGQETIGAAPSRRFRRNAQVTVQIFTPKNEGTTRARQLAAEARAIYEARSFGGLDFNNARILPTLAEEKWQATSVEADFQFEEIK